MLSNVTSGDPNAAAGPAYRASTPHQHAPEIRLVTPETRAIANGHRGVVLWLTGLPGSGKSTLAARLERELFKRGRQVFALDGEYLRRGLSRDLGYAPAERSENVRRTAEMARLFAEAGLIAIVALISPTQEDRAIARSIVGKNFREIHVKADLTTCERRDPKGLYKAARAGKIEQFTGVSAPYEAPLNPDLTIDTVGLSVDDAVAKLVAYVDGDAAPLAPTDAWAI